MIALEVVTTAAPALTLVTVALSAGNDHFAQSGPTAYRAGGDRRTHGSHAEGGQTDARPTHAQTDRHA